MFTKLSKTVAISVIMYCASLFAQTPQVTERSAIPPKGDSTITTTQEVATPAPSQKLRNLKTIHSYNFNLPIESETWEVRSDKHDWNSLGFQLSWTRYKTEESGYSTLFGLGASYFTGDLKDDFFDDKIEFKGFDLNAKLGLGFAPVSNDLIVAFHFICGVDVKFANGKAYIGDEKFMPAAIYVDATIGGDFIIGYQVLGSMGILAGIDITTNAFGIGGYSRDHDKASKVTQLDYVFSGINFTPHLGIYFAF